MTAAWSPAELSRQRIVVRRAAARAEDDRRRWVAARRAAATKLRGLVTSPWVLGGCFVLGWLIARPAPRRRAATVASRLSHRLSRVAAALVWLTRSYRQFQSGVAAGAALISRPRVAEGTAVHGDVDQES
jgi:hypothetical protein